VLDLLWGGVGWERTCARDGIEERVNREVIYGDKEDIAQGIYNKQQQTDHREIYIIHQYGG